MENQIVISKSEFEELKLLVDDLQCFLASIDPQCQQEISTLFEKDPTYPTQEELNNLF